MFRSLNAQLGAIFLGFLLLVLGSVAATFAAIQAQTDDATVINLAGRQRMLTQKMTWLALSQPGNPELPDSIDKFDLTLRALRDGGTTLDAAGSPVLLPEAPNLEIKAQLDEVGETWIAFQEQLQNNDPAALQAVSNLILTQLDLAVSAFEAESQAISLRLRWIQAVFLAAALLLLGWGYFVTRRRIIQPLSGLSLAARRIGEGHLTDQLPSTDTDELDQLAHSFLAMRDEIAAARQLLESRVERRTRELVTAFEFSQEIVGQLDLDQLLKSVTDRAQSLMQARAAALCLLTDDGKYLRLASSSGDVNEKADLLQSTQRGLALQVVGEGQMTTTEATCSACQFLCDYPTSPCFAAPLRVGDHTIGAMCVVRDNGETFEQDEAPAFRLLANSTAIAIANARLAEYGRQQAERSAALAERERLAADLHDNLAQTLSYLRIKADGVEEALVAGRDSEAVGELDLMKPAISSAYQEVRGALTGLREPPKAVGDLRNELSALVSEFTEIRGQSVDLTISGDTTLKVSSVVQNQVMHIAREALTNAFRHAQARRILVYLNQSGDELYLAVSDDGRGFDTDSARGDDHLGLAIMRARAQRIGGSLVVNSSPGKGTEVVAQIPVRDS